MSGTPHTPAPISKLSREKKLSETPQTNGGEPAGKGRVASEPDQVLSPCNCFAIVQYNSMASASCCFSMNSPCVCAT